MGIFRLLWDLFFAYRKAKKNLESCQRARDLDPESAAYRVGDYEKAKSLASDPFMQAEMLIQLDRAAEAEQILRQMAKTEQNPKLLVLIHSQLGQLLMRQKRYDQAMECFQTALPNWPERGSSYRNIAEWWLRRGESPAEALRWARMAVEKEQSSPGLSDDSKGICLGEDLATLAWAVAVKSHDAAEVERLSEQVAFPATTPVSAQAMSFCMFGYAWTELGDPTRAAVYFDLAAKRDPKGVWGREAASLAVAK